LAWLSVIIGIIASLLFWSLNNDLLFALSVISTIGTFWSWGIMHNFATERAKKRSSYSGEFYDFTAKEVVSVPNWITIINILHSRNSVTMNL